MLRGVEYLGVEIFLYADSGDFSTSLCSGQNDEMRYASNFKSKHYGMALCRKS